MDRTTQASATVIDADALLESGQTPIKPVFDAAGALGPGDVLRVTVSFPPVPLVERLENHGYVCALDTGDDGRYVLTVRRAPSVG